MKVCQMKVKKLSHPRLADFNSVIFPGELIIIKMQFEGEYGGIFLKSQHSARLRQEFLNLSAAWTA